MLHLFSVALLAINPTIANSTFESPTVPAAQAQVRDTLIKAGTYDLSITTGGGLVEATMELAYVGDSLTVVLKVGDHQSPVKVGTRHGNKLTLEPKSAAVDVRYDLQFSGSTLTGTFVYQGDTGAVTGKRRAGS